MQTQAVNSPFPSATNTGKHDSTAWIIIEFMKGLTPIFKACLAVNSLEAEAVFLKFLLNQVKHSSPATENDASNNQLSTVIAFEQNGIRYLLTGFDGLWLVSTACSVRRFRNRASILAEGGKKVASGLGELGSSLELGDVAHFGHNPSSPSMLSLCKAQTVQIQC